MEFGGKASWTQSGVFWWGLILKSEPQTKKTAHRVQWIEPVCRACLKAQSVGEVDGGRCYRCRDCGGEGLEGGDGSYFHDLTGKMDKSAVARWRY